MPTPKRSSHPKPSPEEPSQNLKLPVHPVIASLTSGGQQPPSAVVLAGYVGESDRAGNVRLYLMLSDLSQYIEFEEGAVVRTSPANRLPEKGLYVWVKANTPVRTVREVKASDVARILGRLLRR
jgi:hypothetical protein